MFARAVVLFVVVCVASPGRADAGALEEVRAKLAACGTSHIQGNLDAIGTLTKVEPIGKRPIGEAAHLYGTKARAYAAFADDQCIVVAVVGKAVGAVRGSFGGGGVVAYLVRAEPCSKESCATFLSIKSSTDALVDALPVDGCPDAVELDKIKLFDDRDSLKMGCWTSSGADGGFSQNLFGVDKDTLHEIHKDGIGIEWVQIGGDGGGPWCRASVPTGIAVGKRGATPEIDVVTQPRGDDETVQLAAKQKVEWIGTSGCDQNTATTHLRYDASQHKFVAVGSPKIGIRRKICKCPKGVKPS